jgi:hypothetical protein
MDGVLRHLLFWRYSMVFAHHNVSSGKGKASKEAALIELTDSGAAVL